MHLWLVASHTNYFAGDEQGLGFILEKATIYTMEQRAMYLIKYMKTGLTYSVGRVL